MDKQDLKELFQLLEKSSSDLFQPHASNWTANIDDNGVVYLKDENGHTRVIMCLEDYEALKKWSTKVRHE